MPNAPESEGSWRLWQERGTVIPANSFSETLGLTVWKVRPKATSLLPQACLPSSFFLGSSNSVAIPAGCAPSSELHRTSGRLLQEGRLLAHFHCCGASVCLEGSLEVLESSCLGLQPSFSLVGHRSALSTVTEPAVRCTARYASISTEKLFQAVVSCLKQLKCV